MKENSVADREYVEIETANGTCFVINNDVIEPNTLLVCSSRPNDYIKIPNNMKAFNKLRDAFSEHRDSKRIQDWGLV